jgi:hypothetical protein
METTRTAPITAADLTVGQPLGPFQVAEITDEKVALFDRTAQNYRNTKSVKWLKLNSPILASIINRANREA